jgi:NADP-dependent 3-hydroxy acid dehydrogenase YdfG
MQRFENRTVLVTGAGSGIGAACVRRLFAEGASVVAADIRKEAVDKVVAEFGGSNRIYGVGIDVSDRDQVGACVSGAVRRFGNLHGLVNSAGIRGVGNILDLELDTWRKVLAVNLEGTFNMCQAFARAAKEAKTPAAIVNLTSAAGIRGVPNRLPYAASKYGVVDHSDHGLGTRAARRSRQRRGAGHDPHGADRGDVCRPGKRTADPRRASHRPRGPARRSRGSDCVPAFRRCQFRHRRGLAGRWRIDRGHCVTLMRIEGRLARIEGKRFRRSRRRYPASISHRTDPGSPMTG